MRFEVKDGTFSYTKDRIIFKDINFLIDRPGVLAVLGANATGKTTLMKCMLGLLLWTDGASYLNSKDIKDYKIKDFWRTIGYVPQAKVPSFAYTVEEMVALGRSAHLNEWSRPGKKDMEIVHHCLELVRISDLRHKLCTQISGGQYQLTVIARALATQPQLLILDEPESNLDFKNQMVIINTIRELCDTQNISAIMNTHFPEHAAEIADKALILMPDSTSKFDLTPNILTPPVLEEAFEIPVHIEKIKIPGGEHTSIFPIPTGRQ